MSNINSVDINEKVYVSGIVDFSRGSAYCRRIGG